MKVVVVLSADFQSRALLVTDSMSDALDALEAVMLIAGPGSVASLFLYVDGWPKPDRPILRCLAPDTTRPRGSWRVTVAEGLAA